MVIKNLIIIKVPDWPNNSNNFLEGYEKFHCTHFYTSIYVLTNQ